MPDDLNLLDMAKLRLRLKSDVFDNELEMHIGSAKALLKLSGVNPALVDEAEDSIIKNAITAYVCSQFGLDNPDVARFSRIFNSFLQILTLSGEYRNGVVG